jgi:hypothetical protein
MAVSAGANPLGAWYRYAFQISATKLNDYPHFGVWPDGYYMSVNQFDGSSLFFAGAGSAVFESEKMLAGQPARMVYFDTRRPERWTLAACCQQIWMAHRLRPGRNIFVEWDDSTWLGDPQDTLRLWEFHVDWTNPPNSTFENERQFRSELDDRHCQRQPRPVRLRSLYPNPVVRCSTRSPIASCSGCSTATLGHTKPWYQSHSRRGGSGSCWHPLV